MHLPQKCTKHGPEPVVVCFTSVKTCCAPKRLQARAAMGQLSAATSSWHEMGNLSSTYLAVPTPEHGLGQQVWEPLVIVSAGIHCCRHLFFSFLLAYIADTFNFLSIFRAPPMGTAQQGLAQPSSAWPYPDAPMQRATNSDFPHDAAAPGCTNIVDSQYHQQHFGSALLFG